VETFRIWSPGVKTKEESLSPEASLILPSSWFIQIWAERKRKISSDFAGYFQAFRNVQNGKADAETQDFAVVLFFTTS